MLLKPPGLALTLPLLLTKTEIAGETAQSPPAISPDTAELEKDGGVGCALRVGQQTLKLIEPLLCTKNCAILLAYLVLHPLPLPLELGELALQLGAIPEKAEEPVIVDRLAAGEQLPGKG